MTVASVSTGAVKARPKRPRKNSLDKLIKEAGGGKPVKWDYTKFAQFRNALQKAINGKSSWLASGQDVEIMQEYMQFSQYIMNHAKELGLKPKYAL